MHCLFYRNWCHSDVQLKINCYSPPAGISNNVSFWSFDWCFFETHFHLKIYNSTFFKLSTQFDNDLFVFSTIYYDCEISQMWHVIFVLVLAIEPIYCDFENKVIPRKYSTNRSEIPCISKFLNSCFVNFSNKILSISNKYDRCIPYISRTIKIVFLVDAKETPTIKILEQSSTEFYKNQVTSQKLVVIYG